MTDLDRQLYDLIRDRAGRIGIPGGDVDSVVARGRARRRRTRVATSVVAAAAAGSAAGIGISTIGSSGHPTKVFEPAAGTGASATQLSWRQVPVTAGLTMEFELTGASNGVQYAVSTGPGVANAGNPAASNEVLYSSTNGTDWKQVAAPAGVSVADVAVNGGDVYDVGTGAATSAPTVAYSTNGGTSWNKIALPLSMTAPDGALTAGSQVLRVAAGPGGVEVGVGAAAQLDLARLLPGVTVHSWAATPSGVELLGAAKPNACPAGQSLSDANSNQAMGLATGNGTAMTPAVRQKLAQAQASGTVHLNTGQGGQTQNDAQIASVPCSGANGTVYTAVAPADAYQVTASYTWQQLGVSPQAAQALQGNMMLFHSADGRTFTPVDTGVHVSSDGSMLATNGSGFALAGAILQGSRQVVLQSPDGVNWTPTGAVPSAVSWVQALGVAGGNLTMIAQTNESGEAYQLIGGQWVATEQMPQVGAASFGPLGVAVATFKSSGSPQFGVYYSPDGAHWQDYTLQQISGTSDGQAVVDVGSSSVAVTVTGPQGQAQVAAIGTPTV